MKPATNQAPVETSLPMEYQLEIYLPDTVAHPAFKLAAYAPFLPFAVGDLLDPRDWPDAPVAAGTMLRVTGVVHRIVESHARIAHKISVLTSAEPQTERTFFLE